MYLDNGLMCFLASGSDLLEGAPCLRRSGYAQAGPKFFQPVYPPPEPRHCVIFVTGKRGLHFSIST